MDSENSKEWDELFRGYCATCSCVSGTGGRGQLYIDSAYKKLEDFVKIHPEYKEKLPTKYRVSNGGLGGVSHGVAAFGRLF